MITKNAVWLITGCSKGLGGALAEQVLAAGYRVVVTARRGADIADLVAAHGDGSPSRFLLHEYIRPVNRSYDPPDASIGAEC